MTTSELYTKVLHDKPQFIYLSGRTATGKSTFAQRLHDEAGYGIVGLEAALLDIIRAHKLDERDTFMKVFGRGEQCPETEMFFAAVDEAISKNRRHYSHNIIEGAIANLDILVKALHITPDLMFVFFHPVRTDAYIHKLTSRFLTSSQTSTGGLPASFWKYIDEDEFQGFCKTRTLTPSLRTAISRFAVWSQNQSSQRLKEYRIRFSNMVVVEV